MDLASELGHEELLLFRVGGLHAIVAIHDSTFGPAVGGTRMRPYACLDDAVSDALRLSSAMTLKAALAGVERGGGKAVIVGDPATQKSRSVLTAYARAVDGLGGRFHTGCDMGIDGRDVAVMSRLTRHVSHRAAGSTLDTAQLAGLGVFEAIRAAAQLLDLRMQGLRVAVQGLGQVGYHVARQLAQAGARLWVADLSGLLSDRAASELQATVVEPDAIYDADVDVFSPNAAGGILDDDHIGRLRCAAVVGGDNEQLAEARHAGMLLGRGILYAPDYLVNAGGLLSLLHETGDLDEDAVLERVRGIGRRFREIALQAREEERSPAEVAERLARSRLAERRERDARRREGS